MRSAAECKTTFPKPRVRKSVRGIACELVRLFEHDDTFHHYGNAAVGPDRLVAVCLLGGLALARGYHPNDWDKLDTDVAATAFAEAYALAAAPDSPCDTWTACYLHNDSRGRNAVLGVLRKLATGG